MFNVKAFSAKGDGQTDDTQVIEDAIAAIAPQGGVVCLPVGVYQTIRSILLRPQLRLMDLDFAKTLAEPVINPAG